MAKRKPISKKLRFEVFKRDSFTCQYCGKSAPDVILQVDHIHPVAKGGGNDILNLVTSCDECNAGKGARELSDDSALQKQRQQLDDLNSRREQLEMMIKWREGLKDIQAEALDYLHTTWSEVTGYGLTETGLKDLKKLTRKHSMKDIADAMETAAEVYLRYDDDGKVTHESVNLAFRKIPGVLRVRSEPQEMRDLYYIRGICRNRFAYVNEVECLRILKEAAENGGDVEDMKAIAKEERNWTNWTYAMSEYLEGLQNG